ncbi:MAG: hypothetical protein JNK04_16060, partial [Myxococcales bacterium]|nr:hypothetical protein [Myxococcales bacterium]
HAIEARRPRARYVAPFTAAPVIWLMKLFPTRWVDGLLGRASGLTEKSLLGGKPARQLSATAEA